MLGSPGNHPRICFDKYCRGWGALCPLFGVGALLVPFLGLGGLVVALAPFCSGYAFFTIKNACLLNSHMFVVKIVMMFVCKDQK